MNVATHAFDPTRPPPRRLVRLGVVFDGRTAVGALPSLARMCERAGIDIIWVADPVAGTALLGDADAWPLAAGLPGGLRTAAVGAMVDGRRDVSDLVALVEAQVKHWPVETRLELGIVGGAQADDANDAESLRRLRAGLWAVGIDIRLSAGVPASRHLATLLAVADDIVLSAWHTPDLETAADEARAAAVLAGRDPGSLGVAALVPVSVGRTDAEAAARAEMDPDFSRFGHPADIGIFGTLEECQDRVIALAHAGITDLRCVLPATPDIHDVIAQLTAMTIGTVDVLLPGSLRSPAPPPPEGWGGRPDQPPSRGVSAGSRRRR